MVKRCSRTNHTEAPNDRSYAGSDLGLNHVIASVRAAFPELVLENCEDSGCMPTYRIVRLYHTADGIEVVLAEFGAEMLSLEARYEPAVDVNAEAR